MRVAIDARYIREKPSGIGVYVRALVDRLPRLAPADRFLFWAHRLAARPLSSAPNTEEVTVRPGPQHPGPLLWPQWYAPFGDVDVFHNPHNLLPMRVPCASVVTIHDVMAIDRPALHMQGIERFAKSVYYPQSMWRALRQATRVIVPTQATADRVIALVPDARARVRVTLEAAEATFHPAASVDAARTRAAQLIASDAPYLLLVGANAATKRHDLALAAFAQSVPPPWRLVLVHRMGRPEPLARLARRLGIFDRTTWLWRMTRENVAILMQAAGVLVQPSVYEGFGLPVIEAMACGCAIVASDIPPFREITAGAALLFPPDDRDALAAALKAVTTDPERRRALSTAALARSRDFSWDTCAAQTLEVYQEAATAGPTNR